MSQPDEPIYIAVQQAPNDHRWVLYIALALIGTGVLFAYWSTNRAVVGRTGTAAVPTRGMAYSGGDLETTTARLFDLAARQATEHAPTITPTRTPRVPTSTPRPIWDADASTPGAKYVVPPLPPATDIAGPTRTPIYCDRITPDATYQNCTGR